MTMQGDVTGGEMSFCIELNAMRGDVQRREMSLPLSNAGRCHAGKRQAGRRHAGRHHRTILGARDLKCILYTVSLPRPLKMNLTPVLLFHKPG